VPIHSDELHVTQAGLAAARAELRAEAVGWGIKASEGDDVLAHDPVEQSGTILWWARRDRGLDRTLMAATG
jgi:hypothetical protein